jgi:serine/threonine protein kinase
LVEVAVGKEKSVQRTNAGRKVKSTSRPCPLDAGAEPILGYRLLAPLGPQPGEVWKCVAPDGSFKAIKFVALSDSTQGPAPELLAALQRARAFRHPFVLHLDHAELLDGAIALVMELADLSLGELANRCRQSGLPGPPREELLSLLLGPAGALDWMSSRHGLFHLDLEPNHLFLAGNRIKIACFGPAHRPREEEALAPLRQVRINPLYAAPEVWRGRPAPQSDQYSLAIVYQQVLTGALPFWSDSPRELALMHRGAQPDLRSLPVPDRLVVARALSKAAAKRFPSCVAFIEALLGEARRSLGGTLPEHWRRMASADAPALSPDALDAREPATLDGIAVIRGPDLPGYRVLEGPTRSSVGDVWHVADAEGRERRALCPLRPEAAAPLLARLQAISHLALPPFEAHSGADSSLVLVTDVPAGTLHDRFENCASAGLPGVPREELLAKLRPVAGALDDLHRQHRLAHLGLTPQRIWLTGGRVLVADFGLAAVTQLSTDLPAPAHGKYSAPELGDRQEGGSAADQYSLALIYAEMLTGASPRSLRTGHAPRGTARFDLSLVPAGDRPIVARALSPDPALRFPTCLALIEALEAATPQPSPVEDLLVCPPPVVRLSLLLGEGLLPGEAPSISAIVAELTTPPTRARRRSGQAHTVHSDGTWECRCPVRLFPGAIQLKVEGFCEEWGATVVQDGARLRLSIPLSSPARSWWLLRLAQPQMEMEIVGWPADAKGRFSEVRVVLRPPAKSKPAVTECVADLAPRLLQSLRSYLLADADQRAHDRWPCPYAVRVYPLLCGQVGRPLDGTTRDISAGGARFFVPEPLPSRDVYLHWERPKLAPFAVLVRAVRVEEKGDGYEVGAAFAGNAPREGKGSPGDHFWR